MNKEVKLQSDIVRKFSELYPDKDGQLFHVSNERNHKVQAFIARAIGIVPGVADLIYFDKKVDLAIELKVEGSRHAVAKLMKQVEWGKKWEKKGKIWRMCTNVDDAISCINGDLKGRTLKDMKKMLKGVKTKTIKIQ